MEETATPRLNTIELSLLIALLSDCGMNDESFLREIDKQFPNSDLQSILPNELRLAEPFPFSMGDFYINAAMKEKGMMRAVAVF